jgi:transcriptional regulator with XRE-family HTH domain
VTGLDAAAAEHLLDLHLKAVGRQVRVIRRHRDITQESLASRVGTGRARLSRIERGTINITIETVTRVARALDVQPWV